MNHLGRVAAIFSIAFITIAATVGAVVLLLGAGPFGLIMGPLLVVLAPVLSVRLAKGLHWLPHSDSTIRIVCLVWGLPALALWALPLLGFSLTEGDAMGSAVMIGVPSSIVLGAVLGVFFAGTSAPGHPARAAVQQ